MKLTNLDLLRMAKNDLDFHNLFQKSMLQLQNEAEANEILFEVCRRPGNVEQVKITMQCGARDINKALLFACDGGNIQIIHELIKQGATSFLGACCHAADAGHLMIVKLMVQLCGHSCLEMALLSASFQGRKEIVEFLLQQSKICNDFVKLALVEAEKNGHRIVAQMLIAYMNVVVPQTTTSAAPAHLLASTIPVSKTPTIPIVDPIVPTPVTTMPISTPVETRVTSKHEIVDQFMEGCRNGDVKVVKTLLSKIDCLVFQDGLWEASSNGHVDILKLFYVHDAKSFTRNSIVSFQCACATNQRKVLNYFESLGLSHFVGGLIVASEKNNKDLADLLIQKGAFLQLKVHKNKDEIYQKLHESFTKNGWQELVKSMTCVVIVEEKPTLEEVPTEDVPLEDVPTDDMFTDEALTLSRQFIESCRNGDIQVSKKLLSKIHDLDLACGIWTAASHGHIEMLQLFRAHDEKSFKENSKKAFQDACIANQRKVITHLESIGLAHFVNGLIAASEKNYRGLAELCIQKGAFSQLKIHENKEYVYEKLQELFTKNRWYDLQQELVQSMKTQTERLLDQNIQKEREFLACCLYGKVDELVLLMKIFKCHLTTLHRSIRGACEAGHVEILKLLFAHDKEEFRKIARFGHEDARKTNQGNVLVYLESLFSQ